MDIGPGAARILGRDQDVLTGGHVAYDHVEQSFMIPDGGCEQTAGQTLRVQPQLLRIVQGVSDAFPMGQVPAVEQWDAGKEGKRRIRNVIIIPYPADGRIRIKAGNDGVFDLVIVVHTPPPYSIYHILYHKLRA